MLRSGAEPAFPAASLAALATNTAPAHTSTWRDTWLSSQSSFPTQQWRSVSSRTPDVTRKRLLAARGRQAKVHRPSHQTSAVAAPSQTEPAQEGATQLQVQPSEGPATELQVCDRKLCLLLEQMLVLPRSGAALGTHLLCLPICSPPDFHYTLERCCRSPAWSTTLPSSSPGPLNGEQLPGCA